MTKTEAIVYKAVLSRPGMMTSEIAQVTGLAPESIGLHASSLREKNKLRSKSLRAGLGWWPVSTIERQVLTSRWDRSLRLCNEQ